ncbi:MAG: flagellar protein FliS [Pirellulaceae bacterium]|nr:flagellar protein FliS [Pirellulaceae bacterium]
MTATPQRLRLLLINAAMKFANKTIESWKEEKNEVGYESLVRCRAIITELLTSLNTDGSEETKTMISVYSYLFRTLTEAQVDRNQEKMQNVLTVLEEEQRTWLEICEAVPELPPADLAGRNEPKEITSSDAQVVAAQLEAEQKKLSPQVEAKPTASFDSSNFGEQSGTSPASQTREDSEADNNNGKQHEKNRISENAPSTSFDSSAVATRGVARPNSPIFGSGSKISPSPSEPVSGGLSLDA